MHQVHSLAGWLAFSRLPLHAVGTVADGCPAWFISRIKSRYRGLLLLFLDHWPDGDEAPEFRDVVPAPRKSIIRTPPLHQALCSGATANPV